MKTYTKKTVVDFISTHIDIISTLYKVEQDWLRPREKEFLVHNLMLRSQGYDIKSTESVNQLQKLMGFSSRDDVYNYRKKLKEKGWLEQTRDDIVFPELLNVLSAPNNEGIKSRLTYRFALEYEDK